MLNRQFLAVDIARQAAEQRNLCVLVHVERHFACEDSGEF